MIEHLLVVIKLAGSSLVERFQSTDMVNMEKRVLVVLSISLYHTSTTD